MKRYLSRTCVILISLALLLCALCGCAKEEPAKENNERMNALAQEFINELSLNILPLREKPVELSEAGVTVSTQTASYHVEGINDFYGEYQKNENAKLTIAFVNTSFVVTRVVFEDGIGYYFRYQYDQKQKAGEPLAISSKYVTGVNYIINDDAGKVDLTLTNGKAKLANFTFKNIVPQEPKDSDEPAK